MITQNYPLWLVDADGEVWAVVGWLQAIGTGALRPAVVPLGSPVGDVHTEPIRPWVFHTERPES